MKLRNARRIGLVMIGAFAVSAHAQGLDRVDEFLGNIEGVLDGVSIVTVTIAILVAGYLYLFRAASWSLIAWIMGGAILIGGAAQIAQFLVGGGGEG